MTISFACINTLHARDYVAGLGRIWHHEIPPVAPAHVVIPFPIGLCELAATAKLLNITLTAKSGYEIALLEDLISEHLDRISDDERLRYQWIRPADEQRNMRKP